jgi:7-cyano-7-deazaguanine synthase
MPEAVVLLSGGLDSTTCLAIAQAEGFACHALCFEYGQRQRLEVERAADIARAAGCRSYRLVRIDFPASSASALTCDRIAVPKDALDSSVIPITYVPARNMLFLAHAVAWAEGLGVSDIFIGANALDYSGYPDCRPAFLSAFEAAANLGTKAADEGRLRFQIHHPLLDLTKADIIRRGLSLGVDYAKTLSCYDPSPSGAPCRHCDACLLRSRGFEEIGIPDPLLS